MIYKLFLCRTFHVLICFLLSSHHTISCTRIFWGADPNHYLVGRTMDWKEDTCPEIWVYPPSSLEHEIPSYGLLAITAYKEMIVDGINEKGLSGHVLYLGLTKYNRSFPGELVLSSKDWLHHILKYHGSVEEVLQEAPRWRLLPSTVNSHDASIHLALEDPSGNSVILEYKEGDLKIHREKGQSVLTNAPFYEEHLKNLRTYIPFGGQSPLPLSFHSPDRFVKASYALSQLMPVPDRAENIYALKKVLDSISVSAEDTRTYYQTITDISNRSFYYFDVLNQITKVIHLIDINFQHLPPEGISLYSSLR